MKIIYKIITYTIILTIIFTNILFISIKTNYGLNLLIKNIINITNININIKKISGTLQKKITLHEITYIKKNNTTTIKKISLNIKIKKFKTIKINDIKIKIFKTNKHYININAKLKIIKKKFYLNIKNMNGKIKNKEIHGKININKINKKIYINNSTILISHNIIKTHKLNTIIKLNKSNIIKNKYTFKTKIIIKKKTYILIEKILNNKIEIKKIIIIIKKNNKYFKITTSNNKTNNLYTKNLQIKIHGNIKNHNIKISSHHQNLKIKIHGKFLNNNLKYIIKKIQNKNATNTKPSKININKHLLNIKNINLKDNNKKYITILISKLKINKHKRLYIITYIYSLNLNIPKVKILKKKHTSCNIYIKIKMHGKITHLFISTKSLIKFN